MPLTNGSGSCYFRLWPSKCQQKTNVFTQFFAPYCILKVHLHYFSKIKSQKESENRRNQGFSYYFCLMIEGSGSGTRSGSIPLTSGSGSGRPKHICIRWIRIRIHNTDFYTMVKDWHTGGGETNWEIQRLSIQMNTWHGGGEGTDSLNGWYKRNHRTAISNQQEGGGKNVE